ncbi:hypothetical protein GCM10025876_28020 [Demequina litorisediminis]|uniref:Carbohydrate kinase PfkB domain-containing protein n=1 Tax=Demequina litorisediminis TaxID=1849022 RepID=A0ABQ6IHG8_9MICO|nr:hypothetical protein GCM10025876_28020 [Demequina litorisediminis]
MNDWGALAWSRDTGVVRATQRDGLEILDRVGGGDSFASGLIHGLLEGESLERAVSLGAAHGALAMTTPGDTTMATKAEVHKARRRGRRARRPLSHSIGRLARRMRAGGTWRSLLREMWHSCPARATSGREPERVAAWSCYCTDQTVK